MGRDRYVVFEETTPWPSWVALLVYGAGWLSAGGVLAQLWRGREGAVRFGAVAGAALLAAGPLVLQGVFGRLRVQVTRTSLLISFGYLRLISKLVPFTEIRDLEAVKYGPLREFGGWGIRWSFRKTAWTIRGDRALRLTLENGRSLYVGSEDPIRLEERVRQAAGDRFSSRPESQREEEPVPEEDPE